jgi:hypothetical protein
MIVPIEIIFALKTDDKRTARRFSTRASGDAAFKASQAIFRKYNEISLGEK